MPDSPDKPFGIAGRVLGLRVREPEFEEGEDVHWEARANRFQQKFRSVGGRVYLTNRRLIFVPTKFETKIAGRSWSARLADLDHAFVEGPKAVRTVRVLSSGGEEQRFVIGKKAESAARIDAAIQAAKTS